MELFWCRDLYVVHHKLCTLSPLLFWLTVNILYHVWNLLYPLWNHLYLVWTVVPLSTHCGPTRNPCGTTCTHRVEPPLPSVEPLEHRGPYSAVLWNAVQPRQCSPLFIFKSPTVLWKSKTHFLFKHVIWMWFSNALKSILMGKRHQRVRYGVICAKHTFLTSGKRGVGGLVNLGNARK